ncbi:hypothetical protein LJC61_02225 [Ruminococcaceae bacterium OttesenSCG-928-A16]|nr:hypothetical protein [Ruminococcaceae bacterium OttesenSCG-928-A16]
MKTIAFAQHKKDASKSRRMSAYSVYLMREHNPQEYSEYDFFTHKTEHPQKVHIAKRNLVFFRYNRKPLNEYYKNKDSESFTHEMIKTVLGSFETLILSERKDERNRTIIINVNPSQTVLEKTFTIDDNEFIVDIYFEIDSTSPPEYLYKWGGKLIVEVCVTHKVPPIKKVAFENNNLAIFEVKFNDSVRKKFDLDSETDENRAQEKQKMMVGMFRKSIFGNLISDPSTEEYLEMVDLKKAIEKFRQASELQETIFLTEKEKLVKFKQKYESELKAYERVNELEQHLFETNQKLSALEAQKEESKKLILSLKNNIENLEEIIADKNKTIQSMEKERIILERQNPLNKIKNIFKRK